MRANDRTSVGGAEPNAAVATTVTADADELVWHPDPGQIRSVQQQQLIGPNEIAGANAASNGFAPSQANS
jgi:hypothetical protein